jgi:TPP-dependent pyruvate/acetoin dehydrogenase alpha subunit
VSDQIREEAKLYFEMLRIRLVEEALAKRYSEQQMRCPMHLCIGQEAVPVGVCSFLSPSDIVFGNHRAHGYYLAKGGSLKKMVAEIYGKATGCCGGRGGSMHLIDLNVNFMGSTPIVGGTVPLGLGTALATQLRGENQLTVVFFGDGCFEEGVVHESLNYAALMSLPVIFVCENNRYSVYTNLESRQPDRPMYKVAEAHGWEVDSGDGNDLDQVVAVFQEAVSRVKANSCPQFLEFETYRWIEHCGPNDDDHLGYRPAKEVRSWKEQCPVRRAEVKLLSDKVITQGDLDFYRRTIMSEIEESFEFALESPFPSSDSLYNFSNISHL